jgi:hypothetical protein
MGLLQIINGIDDRFINEAQETFTVGYERDGKEYSRNVKANSESDARNKFKDMMDADNNDVNDYRIKGIFKATGMDEELEEMNVTANLDGGAGQPKVPHAFQKNNPTKKDKEKEYSNATSSTGYGVAPKTNNYIKRRDEMFNRAEHLINTIDEGKYTDYRNDDTMTPKKKINTSIKEVNRRLYEIETMINHAMRLKTETGMEDVFWKSTKSRFAKISERMLRIGTKLREFNK